MKTAEELFDEFIEDRMYYEDYIKAHTEHDKEIVQLIDEMINQHKELNKLFPDENNDNITRAVPLMVKTIRNKI